MDHPNAIRNVPEDFHRFVAAPPHRLFAVFDDPVAGERAVARLRGELGARDEDDIWVFFGEEGVRRIDVSGADHGLHAEMVRWLQRLMSADVDYLRDLERTLREGRMVVAVAVAPDDLDRASRTLRAEGGHSLARVAHWNYVPVRA